MPAGQRVLAGAVIAGAQVGAEQVRRRSETKPQQRAQCLHTVSPRQLWRTTARLASLATSLTLRGGEEAPYITDNGNLILDITLAERIANAPALAAELKAMVGVVEHGLFVGMTDTCIVAGPDGPLVVGRQSGAAASL